MVLWLDDSKNKQGHLVCRKGCCAPAASKPQNVVIEPVTEPWTGVAVILRNGYISTFARPAPGGGLARALLQAASNDPLLPQQYAIPRTATNFAWERTRGSREIIIAIADSGCGERSSITCLNVSISHFWCKGSQAAMTLFIYAALLSDLSQSLCRNR
jgi:hypothetical protein